MKAASGAFAPAAAARKSARCFSRCMEARAQGAGLQALSRLRPRGAPGCQNLAAARWWPCGRGSRDGACAPVCSVDRSVSRVELRCSRLDAQRDVRSAAPGEVIEMRRMRAGEAAAAQAWRGLYGRGVAEVNAADLARPTAGARRESQPAQGLHGRLTPLRRRRSGGSKTR